MNRRGFLTACIATCTAPVFVRAASLMPLSFRAEELSEVFLTEANLEKVWIEFQGPEPLIVLRETALLWPGVREAWSRIYDREAPLFSISHPTLKR